MDKTPTQEFAHHIGIAPTQLNAKLLTKIGGAREQ
jgi:hypothetical protein